MNFAMLFHSLTTSALRCIRQWCTPRETMQRSALPPKSADHIESSQVSVQSVTNGCDDAYMLASRRPLRVLRVLEVGQPRATVGRMVISGCMADVCAELGRLAEREAALL